MTAVLAETRGAVMHLTLNRPDSINAINGELVAGVRAHLADAAADDIRAVTIRGGGRGFCAGGDIRGFEKMLEQGHITPQLPDRLHEMIEDIRNLPKPVIAVIHGACAGAGFSLAMACDLAIAADTSTFFLAYSAIALSPDGSSTYFLPRHVGMKKATEMFFTPERMTAAEVAELGLINRVIAADQLEAEAEALADKLATGPTQAYARVKQLMNSTWTNALHTQLAEETRHIVESSQTADFTEGVRAFLDKRKPSFEGK